LLPSSFPPFASPTQGLAPLRLTCHRIDTIRRTGTFWSEDHCFDVPRTDIYFREIDAFLEQRPPPDEPPFPDRFPAQSAERWAEARWRVPSADQSYYGSRARATPAMIPAYEEVRVLAAYGQPDSPDSDTWLAIAEGTRRLSLDARLYWSQLGWQHGRRLFISTAGYVGLAQAQAEPGDLLAVVEGASVPFVFCERPAGGYELVGEAYVDGLMDGEVLAYGRTEKEIFEVC
jgi:hypothetical protein